MRVRLLISYDGTDFCGWQRHKNHPQAPPRPSIQGTLEKALSLLFQVPISVQGSGRTDAGVHALGQVAHFVIPEDPMGKTLRFPQDLCWALRSFLPPSISVRRAWEASEDFHALYSCVKKTYRYWIWNHPRASALLHRYTHWVRDPLDLGALSALCIPLRGRHDFQSFQTKGSIVSHTVREIYEIQWFQRSPYLLEFQVTGSGFLKQMVRNLVGTQLDLVMGRGPQRSPGALSSQEGSGGGRVDLCRELEEILEARDRRRAGSTAPPQGLFLQRVYYPKDIDKRCRRL